MGKPKTFTTFACYKYLKQKGGNKGVRIFDVYGGKIRNVNLFIEFKAIRKVSNVFAWHNIYF